MSFAKDALICSFLAITHTIGSSKVQERMDESTSKADSTEVAIRDIEKARAEEVRVSSVMKFVCALMRSRPMLVSEKCSTAAAHNVIPYRHTSYRGNIATSRLEIVPDR